MQKYNLLISNKVTFSYNSGLRSPICLPSSLETVIKLIKGYGMKDSIVCFNHLDLKSSYSLQ